MKTISLFHPRGWSDSPLTWLVSNESAASIEVVMRGLSKEIEITITDPTYLAIIPNFWARGGTPHDALANAKKLYNKGRPAKYGKQKVLYQIFWVADPEAECDGLGNIKRRASLRKVELIEEFPLPKN